MLRTLKNIIFRNLLFIVDMIINNELKGTHKAKSTVT